VSAAERDEPADPTASPTSVHVHRAVAGDLGSLAWLVERFSPVLLAQARHRIGPALRRWCDPEDVVSDVWIVAVRRITDLRAASDRGAAALVQYLGTVLVRRVRDLARLAAARQAAGEAGDPARETPVSKLEAATTGIVSSAVRHERSRALSDAIDALDPDDRQVVMLRGIEGASLEEAGAVMNITPGAVAVRYHRALKRLRDAVPGSVLADFADD
jgi:RNA polymerase sigma-70 factor (ECF subfamily)